jgi:hypothetical protein
MRKKTQSLFAAALLLACVGLVWAGEDEARALVQKSIDAVGGEANLTKHNATTFTVKGTYYGMGDGLPYTGNYAVQFPGQMRMEIQGVFTVVLNGDKGWVKAGDNVKEMSEQELATHRHDQKAGWMSSVLPLKDKAFTLKAQPDAEVEDRPARVIVASRKDYPDVTLYFDKANHYLVKVEYRTKAAEQNYQEVTADTVYSDFKEVDGVKTAHKMVMKRDGKLFVEGELQTLRAEGKLDASTFAKPE